MRVPNAPPLTPVLFDLSRPPTKSHPTTKWPEGAYDVVVVGSHQNTVSALVAKLWRSGIRAWSPTSMPLKIHAKIEQLENRKEKLKQDLHILLDKEGLTKFGNSDTGGVGGDSEKEKRKKEKKKAKLEKEMWELSESSRLLQCKQRTIVDSIKRECPVIDIDAQDPEQGIPYRQGPEGFQQMLRDVVKKQGTEKWEFCEGCHMHESVAHMLQCAKRDGLLENRGKDEVHTVISRSVAVAIFWHMAQQKDLAVDIDAVAFLGQCHLDQVNIFPNIANQSFTQSVNLADEFVPGGMRWAVRLHLWDRKLQTPIHSHKSNLRSWIIHGGIHDEEFTVRPGNNTTVKAFPTKKDPTEEDMFPLGNCSLFRPINKVYVSGDAYEVLAGVPHRSTCLASDSITLLAWSSDCDDETSCSSDNYTTAGCVYGHSGPRWQGTLMSKEQASSLLMNKLAAQSASNIAAEQLKKLQLAEWTRVVSKPEEWCHKVLEVDDNDAYCLYVQSGHVSEVLKKYLEQFGHLFHVSTMAWQNRNCIPDVAKDLSNMMRKLLVEWHHSEEHQFVRFDVPLALKTYLKSEGLKGYDQKIGYAVIIEREYEDIVKSRYNPIYWYEDKGGEQLLYFVHDADGSIFPYNSAKQHFDRMAVAVRETLPHKAAYAHRVTSSLQNFTRKMDYYISPVLAQYKDKGDGVVNVRLRVKHQVAVGPFGEYQRAQSVRGGNLREWVFEVAEEPSEEGAKVAGSWETKLKARAKFCWQVQNDAVIGFLTNPFVGSYLEEDPRYDVKESELQRILHKQIDLTHASDFLLKDSDSTFERMANYNLSNARIMDYLGHRLRAKAVRTKTEPESQELQGEAKLLSAVIEREITSLKDIKDLNLIPESWLSGVKDSQRDDAIEQCGDAILRTLDLVDKCSYSILVVMGTPIFFNSPGIAPIPVGNLTRADATCWLKKRDAIAASVEPDTVARFTIFQDLPKEALDHWEKDGMVIVDPWKGRVVAVTVECPVKHAGMNKKKVLADGQKIEIGGLRRKTAEAVVCEADCISILLKKKSAGKGDIAAGIVTVRTSVTASSYKKQGLTIPYVRYIVGRVTSPRYQKELEDEVDGEKITKCTFPDLDRKV